MRLFLTLTTGPLCHWGLFAIRARDLPPAGGMEPPSAREIKMFLLFSRVGSGEPTGVWHQGAAPCPSAGAQEGEEKESKKEEGGKERREGAADLVPEREERGQSPPDSSERSGPGAAPRDPLRAAVHYVPLASKASSWNLASSRGGACLFGVPTTHLQPIHAFPSSRSGSLIPVW